MNAITSWNFYNRVEPAWDAMYADCLNAKHTIDMEQYVFAYDDLGKKFIELFKSKAQEGVRIRIICDMVGGITFYMSPAVKELKDAGVQLLFFNPIKLWRVHTFTSWYLRNHRKILIVDSEIGYIGGVGLNMNMKTWRDTHVRVTGPVISCMEYLFDRMWENTVAGRFYPFIRQLFTLNDTSIIPNSPHWRQRLAYWQFVEMMRGAEKYIYITTPYFVPDLRILRVIKLAARRGIDVRLMVPGVSDVRIVYIASLTYFPKLLEAGVKIYQYNGILHAKTVAVDDTWGTVGSMNIDNLSISFNYEANIATSDQKFVQEIKNDFLKDMETSVELKPEALREKKRWVRFTGLLLRPFHKFL